MMVLANSIFLAKQSVSMPTLLERDVMVPTEGHNGKGAVWQISVKSPKPPILSATGAMARTRVINDYVATTTRTNQGRRDVEKRRL